MLESEEHATSTMLDVCEVIAWFNKFMMEKKSKLYTKEEIEIFTFGLPYMNQNEYPERIWQAA